MIDYTKEDFTRSGRRYHLFLDNVGNHSLAACRRLLTPGGTYIPNSGSGGGKVLGVAGRLVRAVAGSMFGRHKVANFVTRENAADLDTLRELIEAGKITPAIDRSYPLARVSEAIGHVERAHARGKVVITA